MSTDSKKKTGRKKSDDSPVLNKKQEKLLQDVVSSVEGIVDELHDTPPPTREFSLMLTKLEEAEMWGQRAFAILGYEPEEDPDDDDDDDDDDAEDTSEEEEKG